MKKSMIAAAVVATAALAGSANATFFTISSATVVGATLTTPAGTYASGNASANFTVNTGSIANAGASGVNFASGAGLTTTLLTVTQTASIAGAVGASNGTLSYFGFDNGGTAPAYFGFVFQSSAAGQQFTWNFSNATAANAAQGVFASADLGVTAGTGGAAGWSGSSFFGSVTSIAAGEIYLGIFSGMQVSDFIGGANVSDGSFNVSYLSYNGSSWATVASATGASSSNLNVATYSIPVPAPALLAGAGLIGAAAIRRRMAKKA